jgi:hypothetical protein
MAFRWDVCCRTKADHYAAPLFFMLSYGMSPLNGMHVNTKPGYLNIASRSRAAWPKNWGSILGRRRQAEHSAPSNAEVKNGGGVTPLADSDGVAFNYAQGQLYLTELTQHCPEGQGQDVTGTVLQQAPEVICKPITYSLHVRIHIYPLQSLVSFIALLVNW